VLLFHPLGERKAVEESNMKRKRSRSTEKKNGLLLDLEYTIANEKQGTRFAGLPVFFELGLVLGIKESVEKHIPCRRECDGWKAWEIIIALILLNLAGGEHIEDIEVLERDRGLAEVMFRARYRDRKERRRHFRSWRKGRERAFPSKSTIKRFLYEFHNEEQEKERERANREGWKAFVPEPNDNLKGLAKINGELIYRVASLVGYSRLANIDIDATLIQSEKVEAYYTYKGYKGYQPISVWWHDLGLVLYTEFRDGNVPAGWQILRVTKDALRWLPNDIEHLRVRSDSAGYQHDFMRYLDSNCEGRFKTVEFAIGCDVVEDFKRAVEEVKSKEWRRICKVDKYGEPYFTSEECADVCYVPNEVARKKDGYTPRYIAIRQALEPTLPGMPEPTLPFPTMHMEKRRYKVHGIATNTEMEPEDVVKWYHNRSGKSEEFHHIVKHELAGGVMPCGRFGANAAWWWIAVISHNLFVAMKLLALPKKWKNKRVKALRLYLTNLPGRIVTHARRLTIKLTCPRPLAELVVYAHERIQELAWGYT